MQFQEDFLSATLREESKVRGMIGKGMRKDVSSIIPLTIIPLTSLRPFPSSIFDSPSSLWLRLAALGVLSLFAANPLKCLSMNKLHATLTFPSQTRSNPVKPFF
jgi:hypothetical protein